MYHIRGEEFSDRDGVWYKSRGVLLVDGGNALTDDVVEQHPKGTEISIPISEGQAKPHLGIGTKK